MQDIIVHIPQITHSDFANHRTTLPTVLSGRSSQDSSRQLTKCYTYHNLCPDSIMLMQVKYVGFSFYGTPGRAGSLEPQIEVLINRINEVQQESLRILRLHCQEKESEAQRKHTLLQECKERIFALNSQIEEEKNKQRQLRLDFEEQLEALMSQHKDLWEFHLLVTTFKAPYVLIAGPAHLSVLPSCVCSVVRRNPDEAKRPEQLARETCTLDSSKEQLLKEEKLVEVKLEDVKHRLCSLCRPEGPSTLTEGLFLRSQEAAATVHLFKEENQKAEELLEAAAQHHQQLQQRCQQLQQKRQRLKEELEKHGLQVPAQTQSLQEEGAGPQKASPKTLEVHEEKDSDLPTKQGLMPF
ncbi:Hypothetical predicted protein [Marmota monax]|uniref:Synaptonemal complex central element protein 1 n=1 Tax=Marmota monax TaxID=9995 RepID=A0A5E4D0W8_MARMO|nr:hypothetical protein GHT09_010076 [Marmota monax]VTJ87706.1 Hypothetical predicted protein [Marmota monax]